MSVFVNFSVFAVTPPKNESEGFTELRALGMSRTAINRFVALSNEFKVELSKLSENPNAVDKYLENFRRRAYEIRYSLEPPDREIYENYLIKNGVTE
ncbi:unnamed protein product [Caenorhabditis brenneri]